MSEIRALKPENVFGYFDDICAIPHGSGNMVGISSYLLKFAEEHNLEHRTDEARNVIMVKGATLGYEDEPAVILQAHIDMVCTKTEDCTIDMSCEAIKPYIDGAYVKAEGTTLGADNGIGAAMILAILEDTELKHPRIEALFTADEETSMNGAKTVDMSQFQGKRLLNLDSEIEGEFTISSSGGATIDMELPITREAGNGDYFKISVTGVSGGHSGAEIHRDLANANILLGRALKFMKEETNIKLVTVHGGKAHNVVSNFAEAVVLSDMCLDDLDAKLSEFEAVLRNEYVDTDPNVTLNCFEEKKCDLMPLSEESENKVIVAMYTALHGEQHMSFAIEDLVETSLNYALVDVTEEKYTATVSVRSSVKSRLEYVVDKVITLAKVLGISSNAYNFYPEWPLVKDSALREKCVEVYNKVFGKLPKVVALHAGLECGILSEKMLGLDAIAIGPNLYGVHTSDESMEIESTARVYRYVCEVLEEKENN